MPVSNRNKASHPIPDAPSAFRPYAFHGIDLTLAGGHGTGDCPFCGKPGKFSVDAASGLWRCFVCGAGTVNGGGNALVFIRLLYEHGGRGDSFHAAVAADRGYAQPDSPAAWGVRQSPIDGAWLVPGYNPLGRLDQLYRRTPVLEKGIWVKKLLPTPGIWPEGRGHALHLPVGDFDPARPNVMICEGPWDGMALWEAWRGHQATTNSDVNIIAVPGCNVWRAEWTAMCKGKEVTLLFDSDHPRKENERVFRAGYDGMARIARRLAGTAAVIRYLRWGAEGYDPEKPNGWDIRDELGLAKDPAQRIHVLDGLLGRVAPVPTEWAGSPTPSSNGHASGYARHAGGLESTDCDTWEKCEEAWIDALQWRADMSEALAVLLAICASTQQGGNQLFLQLVGNAGSGKTTMCDGLLVSPHCHHLEHLTGFYSGWKKEGEPDKDCSLIARINGKTLITPEADVLISDPKFDELMGQQRRIFDGKGGSTYKNTDEDRLYVGLRTPWIMAGTPGMMDYGTKHQAHLGDRFLRFIIADPSEEEKRAILKKALKSERVAIMESANGSAGSILDPKTRRAHACTGGYVDWLRAYIEDKLPSVAIDEAAEDYCIDLAELSADFRARPNEDKRKIDTHDSKELPTRLARQNIRLASCLAVVLNRPAVDADILRIVRKVALDTANGHSLNITRWLCSRNPKAGEGPYHENLYQETGGVGMETLAVWAMMTPERMHNYLMFLRRIGVVEWQQDTMSRGAWILTDRVYRLYLRVMGS